MDEITLDAETRSERQEWSWTPMNIARAKDIAGIVGGLKEYWPLTVRQVYYQLISSQCIKDGHWHKYGNPKKGIPKDLNQAVGTLLKWMRIDEVAPWDSINDEGRITGEKPGWDDMETFLDGVEDWIQDLCRNYQRCNSQGQDNYIEVWLEKAALRHIVMPITDKYCKRLIVNRGYSSVTFLNNYRERAKEAVESGQQPIVLYYGDWDPSGVNMLYANYQTLVDNMGFWNARFYRGALNPEQFHLIKVDPVALKSEDKRSAKFEAKHGSIAFELDALHPKQLQDTVEQDILGMTNIDTLQCETEMGEVERKRLEALPGIIEKECKNFLDVGNHIGG